MGPGIRSGGERTRPQSCLLVAHTSGTSWQMVPKAPSLAQSRAMGTLGASAVTDSVGTHQGTWPSSQAPQSVGNPAVCSERLKLADPIFLGALPGFLSDTHNGVPVDRCMTERLADISLEVGEGKPPVRDGCR
ncbi:hypothetical protein chiPu_0029206 [Chiloscyllium punctatum]|uniref:Uncharacterized protein n=1 Tax=Chiloscyllium punctatum TaxID=137246 RepID=A0A401TRY0_CHIPU|nr:hypothetical protein [Chiloscyllium punctatum]